MLTDAGSAQPVRLNFGWKRDAEVYSGVEFMTAKRLYLLSAPFCGFSAPFCSALSAFCSFQNNALSAFCGSSRIKTDHSARNNTVRSAAPLLSAVRFTCNNSAVLFRLFLFQARKIRTECLVFCRCPVWMSCYMPFCVFPDRLGLLLIDSVKTDSA